MAKTDSTISAYAQAGVDTDKQEEALTLFFKWIGKSFDFPKGKGAPLLDIDYFANVIYIGGSVGLALSTDGGGTKILVAQMMNKYDTLARQSHNQKRFWVRVTIPAP
ncbi:MAG: hypothetical protein ACE5OR_13480 [bacterium]